jgi:hypothetical protein
MDYAFTYAEGVAMETETQYPYTGYDGTCHAEGGSVTVKSFVDVTANDPTALATAVNDGPTSVAVDAAGLGW